MLTTNRLMLAFVVVLVVAFAAGVVCKMGADAFEASYRTR